MNSSPSNGIGNITNSEIQNIVQKIAYNTELSEEIKAAILTMSKLLAEDMFWKRLYRFNTELTTLKAARKQLGNRLFFWFFLIGFSAIAGGLVWTYGIEPFNQYRAAGYNTIQTIQAMFLPLMRNNQTVIISLFILAVGVFVLFVSCWLSAHGIAYFKYRRIIKKVSREIKQL